MGNLKMASKIANKIDVRWRPSSHIITNIIDVNKIQIHSNMSKGPVINELNSYNLATNSHAFPS